MKFIYATILLFILSITVNAQDIITLNNAEEIQAKVEQVGIEDIVYKKYNNLTGPSYRILKSTIFMIKYENGVKEVFSKPGTSITEITQAPPAKPELRAGRGRFRLDQDSYSYKETGDLLQDPKYADAYKTYKTAKIQHSFSKPAIIIGMIAGIAGSVVTGVSLLLYTNERSLINSSSSYSYNYGSSARLNDYGTAAVTAGAVGIIGWTSFTYGFVLKSRSQRGFRKTAEQYNAVAKF